LCPGRSLVPDVDRQAGGTPFWQPFLQSPHVEATGAQKSDVEALIVTADGFLFSRQDQIVASAARFA
jgi:hypothetical protein